jgi:outer membrane protein TolC
VTFVTSVLLCLYGAVPSPQAAPPLTVEEAVSWAIRENPELLAVARETDAARVGVRSARALANPEITFAPGLTSRSGSDEELLVQQPLEVNGTRSGRADAARARLSERRARAVVGLRDLVFDTKVAYFELVRSQELESLADEMLRTAEEFDKNVRRQVEEGLRPGVDQIQTSVEASRARQELTRREGQVAIARAALNTLMGRAPDESIGTLSPLTFEAVAVDRDALLEQALAARAEIAAEEASRQASLAQARVERAQGRPDLVPHFRAESVVRGFEGVGVGLGISLPLWDYGSRRGRIREAESLADAQEARVAAARNRVRREVEQALARVAAAEAVIGDYQDGVLAQAGQLHDGHLKGFQLGAPGSSVLTVLEAQRTDRSVQTEYTEALADHWQARAELERATGQVPASLLLAGQAMRRPK